MILKMEKISAFGLLSDKDAVIRALMRERCVQLSAPETLESYDELKELTEVPAGDVYALEQRQSRYAAALSGMSFYTQKAGMFASRPSVDYDKLEDAAMLEKAEAQCAEVEAVVAEISELRGAKNKDLFLKASLEPWAGDGLPMELTGTRAVSFARYLLPAKADMQMLEARRAKAAPAGAVGIVSEDKEQRYVIAFCHRSEEDALWDVLKEHGAARASFSGLTGTAKENIASCDKRIARVDARIAELENKLREIGKDIYPLKYAYDLTAVQIQRGKANNDLLSTRETFCFTGWVPETTKSDVQDILDEYGCHYRFEQAADKEEPPILLKNSKIVTPFESVTEMYSLPAYRCMDPDGVVSFWYFLIFGMMLSDAGLGLLLVIGGFLLLQKKGYLTKSANAMFPALVIGAVVAFSGAVINSIVGVCVSFAGVLIMGAALYTVISRSPSQKGKLIKVITMGGVSTVFWGTIFGSWFGDLIPTIAKVFLGVPEYNAFIILDPLQQALNVMIISMSMGFVHIMVGMGLKAYLLIKRGHPWEALFDVGFWMMTLIGLVAMLAAMILLGTESMVFTVGVILAVAGAIGLVLTQGRDKKNPIMKLMNGITSLYDVTGYLSDVLSYSRILALGLASGVIAQVFNIMGTLAGGGILGAIIFIVVFALGTVLNVGINTLGSYVHTARLQYVEFFGKFYEAGGKPFKPLMAQTKYIDVINKEEI